MGAKNEMDSAENSRIYKRARKTYLATSVAEIHCAYCRPHRGENMSRQQKSWKKQSKRRRQYKPL